MEIEVFDLIVRLNRMNDKLTELVTRSEYESKTPAQKLALEYVNSNMAARLLHVSPRTLSKMRAKASIPFSKIGRKIVYSTEDLRKYLEGNSKSINLR